MSGNFDHILLIGFGGPESPEQVLSFLRRVTAGRNIPDERLAAVAKHYEAIGGRSFYNPWAAKLQLEIQEKLQEKLPVFLGHRNTAPFLNEKVLEIHQKGLKKGVGVILAPFRSTASCRRYKENIHNALHEHGITDLEYRYLEPWYRDADWIRLLAAKTQKAIEKIPSELWSETDVYFACHSIPSAADKACSSCIYSAEYETACRLVAEALNLQNWKHVYQSRSGDPSQPWLEPDILASLKKSSGSGKKAVLVIPMGFLSDNAEVLYDLDIEAKNLAGELGLGFYRVETPGNDPELTNLFIKLIQHALENKPAAGACSV